MPLLDKIKQRIRDNGHISVSDFMSITLTDIQYGYYTKNRPIGQGGDFITAPEISQVFGELIGLWLATQWQDIGCPKDVLLVELGAGNGTLMADILRVTKKIPDFHDSIEVNIIDIGEELIEKQKLNLGINLPEDTSILKDFNLNIKWLDSLQKIVKKPILLIGNEFLDALPIDQYVKTKNGWCHRVITLDKNDNLQFDIDHDSYKELNLIKPKCSQKIGAIYEHSQAANDVVKFIANHIKNYGGSALLIDYGYFENHYKNSLQAVKNHRYSNILEDVGEADITYHVNFAKMVEIAKKSGANAYSDVTQGEFLRNMGINIRAQMLKKNSNNPLAIDRDIARLIDDDQMGDLFKCMAILQPDRLHPVGFE